MKRINKGNWKKKGKKSSFPALCCGIGQTGSVHWGQMRRAQKALGTWRTPRDNKTTSKWGLCPAQPALPQFPQAQREEMGPLRSLWGCSGEQSSAGSHGKDIPGVPTPLGCGEILALFKHSLKTSGTPNTERTMEYCPGIMEWFGLERTLELIQLHGQGPLHYPRFFQAPHNIFQLTPAVCNQVG